MSPLVGGRRKFARRGCLGILPLLAVACGDATEPAGPDEPELPVIVSDAVVDGAHGGIDGFLFLPPLAPEPTPVGAFDADLLARLSLEICEPGPDGCRAPPVVILVGDTAGGRVADLRADVEAGHYIGDWRTGQVPVVPGAVYRIRALVDDEELGYADVRLLPAGETGAGVALGDTLPVRFRIRAGVVDHFAVTVGDLTTDAGLVEARALSVSPSSHVAVAYWTDGEPRMMLQSPAANFHQILFTRLLPASTYQYEMRFDGPGLGSRTLEGTFESDTLPANLAAVTLTSTGVSTASLVMLELRPPTFQGFAAVDSRGRIVWFHQTGGASWSWTRRANGNFVFLDTQNSINEVTPTGEVVAGVRPADVEGEIIHHDVIATPQNTLYFLTREPQDFSGTTWVGEGIWEWSPETGMLAQRWSSSDHLSPATDVGPRTRVGDWLHGNSLAIGASGNVIVSLQFLDQVVALTPDFSTVAWRLGGPNATFALDSVAVFSGQHTADEIAGGRVLLFDNRRVPLDGQVYSRALEIALDFDSSRASRAWDFRPPNDNYSAIISSARRMENGNTLIAFGAGSGVRGSIGPIEVYEVTTAGAVVWNLVIQGPRLMYRATPFDRIAQEMVDTN